MAREALHYARHSVTARDAGPCRLRKESARLSFALYGGPVRQPDPQQSGRLCPGGRAGLDRRTTTTFGITRCLGCLR